MPCLARLCPAWPCLRASVPLILAFLALVAAPRLLSAQGEGLGQGVGGGMMPMGGGNQQWNIMVTPQSYFTSRADNTNDHVDAFNVKNTGTSTAEFEVSCSRTGRVSNCSPDVTDFVLASGATNKVYVTYDVGTGASGTLTLEGINLMGQGVDDEGTMEVVAPPSIVLEVPAGTGRAVVRNRQPILRALLKADVNPAGRHDGDGADVAGRHRDGAHAAQPGAAGVGGGFASLAAHGTAGLQRG